MRRRVQHESPSLIFPPHKLLLTTTVWSGPPCPFERSTWSPPGLFSIYRLSLSLFSCYETLQLKPRLPQFITGGTKAKALDKAGQTNSNQLPLNTHITPLSAPLTYKWPIQDFSFFLFYLFFTMPVGWMKKCSGCTIRSQQVEDLPHLERYSLWDILVTISGNKVLQHDRKNNTWYVFHGVPQFFFFFF